MLCRWRYSPGTIRILAILYSVYFCWLSLWVLHSWTSRGKNGGRPTSVIIAGVWVATFVVITLAVDLGNLCWHCPLLISVVRKSNPCIWCTIPLVYLYQGIRGLISIYSPPTFDEYRLLNISNISIMATVNSCKSSRMSLFMQPKLTFMLQIDCSSIIICKTFLGIKQPSRGIRDSWGRNTTVIGWRLPIVWFFYYADLLNPKGFLV